MGEEELQKIKEMVTNHKFALEMLQEQKATNLRSHELSLKLIKSLIIVTIVFLVAIIGSWVYFEYTMSQYDFVSYTQDGNGYNNAINGSAGDINNGTASSLPNTQK